MTDSNEKYLGIYVHIPFCIKKCVYCDFLSGPADDSVKERYIDTLCREIRDTAKQIDGKAEDVRSIFFGGGTPSAIKAELIEKVMHQLRESFTINQEAEISIECNPGTLDREKADIYRRCGINRISFGLQSAHDDESKMLGRIHTFAEFKESILIAREAGFGNINVDLMSALPGQTIEKYQSTLEKVLTCNPEHISAYSLIIEERTYLHDHLMKEYPKLPDEDTEREMYYLTERVLADAGYEHYEISNFAKPGKECRHNLSYWERKNYLGFGIGAASLFHENRYTNTTQMKDYLNYRQLSEVNGDRQVLVKEEQMEEFMFLGLRKIQGINLDEFSYEFSMNIEDVYKEVIDENRKLGLLEMTGNCLKLTGRGIDVSNVVMSDFLLT